MTQTSTTKTAILLVDDDKFLLELYAIKFTAKGFTVQSSLSATDALKQLHDGFKPDAILFDIVMPDGDGFFFLEALKKEQLAPQALRIALTNEMNQDEQQQAMELGATRYIVKATMIPSEVVTAVIEELRAVHKKKA